MRYAEFGLVTCLAFEAVLGPFSVEKCVPCVPCASSAPSRGGPWLCCVFDPWNPDGIQMESGIQKDSMAINGASNQEFLKISEEFMLRCCPFTIFYHLLPHLSSTSFNFQLQKTMCRMCFQYTAIHYLVIIRQYTASLHSCLTPWSRQPRNSWHITLNSNVKQTQRHRAL